MARLSCDEVRDRLELHALGALTADEADDVDGHLTDCPDCHAALEQALETVAAMSDAAEELDPIDMPSDAKSRVWKRIAPADAEAAHDTDHTDVPSAPSWLERLQAILGGVRWRWAVAGVNVALLIVLGGLIYQQQTAMTQLDQQLDELRTGFEILLSRSDEDASSTFLSATSEGESGSWGTVISHPESELALVLVGDISRPPADAEYHVWFKRNDSLLNAGAVRFGTDELTENKGWLITRKPETVSRVLVTLEPAGDTPEERPAGPTVLASDYH